MKYEHMEEKTRWYEYGLGKEFKTKDEAIRKLESDVKEKMTEFYLDSLYKLYEGEEIEDIGVAVRKIIKFKYPISIILG